MNLPSATTIYTCVVVAIGGGLVLRVVGTHATRLASRCAVVAIILCSAIAITMLGSPWILAPAGAVRVSGPVPQSLANAPWEHGCDVVLESVRSDSRFGGGSDTCMFGPLRISHDTPPGGEEFVYVLGGGGFECDPGGSFRVRRDRNRQFIEMVCDAWDQSGHRVSRSALIRVGRRFPTPPEVALSLLALLGAALAVVRIRKPPPC
jgi:hypothetical protein